MIPAKERKYIPTELEIKWETLEPIYRELTGREINSAQELEQWLLDRILL
jgi:oligoendopeptidase F